MTNSSISAAFKRMWQYIAGALNEKSDSSHNHDAAYDALGSADTALSSAKAYADTVASEKTQVQMITWEADD